MTYEWPYFQLVGGRLYYENGLPAQFQVRPPIFRTIEEAEDWLEENDLRGTIYLSKR